jgi:hypothetical protein
MSTRRELEALRRRLSKILPIVQPPELSMTVISGDDPMPDPSPWNLTLYIESKKETLAL